MAAYVVLASFTDQGIRAVKETTKRAKAFRDLAGQMNVSVKEIYWTLGHYDVVVTLESAKEENVVALMLKVGSLGNLKSQTLRAFGEAEVSSFLNRI